MEFFGVAITVLAAILTYQAWNNGRWMKQTSRDTQNWMKQAHNDTQELIKQTHQDMQSLVKQGHQGTLEILARIEKGQQEARKEMAEAIKYLADLIVSEGNKTRQALKS